MTIGYDKMSPLCDQVKHLILGDLKIGHDRVETYLPSETDLCERYGVSRITLSWAISELCSEDHLKLVRSKGTLVMEPTLQQTLISLTGFTESLATLGHRILEEGDCALPEGVRDRLFRRWMIVH
jgi:GntR family transcriptional regulator, frlABCD operon transcriptional regulator